MQKTKNNLLMVFMKNPVKGKVKTRLAETVGDERLLVIYNLPLLQTAIVTKEIHNGDKAIFYSDFIGENDLWSDGNNHKYLQTGINLGERMKNAFALAF